MNKARVLLLFKQFHRVRGTSRIQPHPEPGAAKHVVDQDQEAKIEVVQVPSLVTKDLLIMWITVRMRQAGLIVTPGETRNNRQAGSTQQISPSRLL